MWEARWQRKCYLRMWTWLHFSFGLVPRGALEQRSPSYWHCSLSFTPWDWDVTSQNWQVLVSGRRTSVEEVAVRR